MFRSRDQQCEGRWQRAAPFDVAGTETAENYSFYISHICTFSKQPCLVSNATT